MKAAELLLDRFVDDSVIRYGRFPAHAAEEADSLHVCRRHGRKVDRGFDYFTALRRHQRRLSARCGAHASSALRFCFVCCGGRTAQRVAPSARWTITTAAPAITIAIPAQPSGVSGRARGSQRDASISAAATICAAISAIVGIVAPTCVEPNSIANTASVPRIP